MHDEAGWPGYALVGRATRTGAPLLWLWLGCACAGGASEAAEPPQPDQVRVEPLHQSAGEEPAVALPFTPPAAPPPRAMGWCLRSRMCDLEGLCSPSDGGLCIAEADSDCQGSKACLGGRCSARGGVCVAASDQDCRESLACKGYGRCAFDGADACSATAEADCRASSRCQREGACKLADGACVK